MSGNNVDYEELEELRKNGYSSGRIFLTDRHLAAMGGIFAPALVIDTNGSVASVDDASDMHALSVVSEIKQSTSGVTDVTLTHTGKNLVSHLDYIITQYNVDTVMTEDCIDVITPSGYDYGKIPVFLKGGVTYTLVIDWEVYGRAEDATDVTTCSYRIDKLHSSANSVNTSSNVTKRFAKTYTATEDIEANILWYPNFGSKVKASSRSRIMLLEGEYTTETAPAFEPCNKQIITAKLPETVYGGTMNWTTGLLTITHGADGTALTEPVTHQLEPQQINMLNGCNTIWSNAGDTSLVYAADIKLYIDNAVATLAASMLNV